MGSRSVAQLRLLKASSAAALWAACGDLLHLVPVGCRKTACSAMGLSWAAVSSCSGPGAPPALLLHWLHCFSHISYCFLPTAVVQQFFPFWNLHSQSTPGIAHGSALAGTGPIWSSWTWLWSDVGSGFSQRPPRQPPHYQTLANWTQYTTDTDTDIWGFWMMIGYTWTDTIQLPCWVAF